MWKWGSEKSRKAVGQKGGAPLTGPISGTEIFLLLVNFPEILRHRLTQWSSNFFYRDNQAKFFTVPEMGPLSLGSKLCFWVRTGSARNKRGSRWDQVGNNLACGFVATLLYVPFSVSCFLPRFFSFPKRGSKALVAPPLLHSHPHCSILEVGF